MPANIESNIKKTDIIEGKAEKGIVITVANELINVFNLKKYGLEAKNLKIK